MTAANEHKLSSAIDKFCSGLWGELDHVDINFLLSSSLCPESLSVRIFGSSAGLDCNLDLDDLCTELLAEGEILKVYKKAVISGKLLLPGIFSHEASECSRSYHTNYGTFLEFSSAGEIFYLVQVRTSFDGFYFPRFNLFYGSSLGAVAGSVRDFIKSLLVGVRSSKISRVKKPVEKMLGFWAGHQLPYHYFYDYLPGAHELFLDNILSTWKPEVGFYTNGGYLNLKNFYADISAQRPLLHVKGCVYSPVDGFFVSSLRSPNLRVSRIAPALDSYISKRASCLFFNTAKGKISERQLGECTKIIWIGVIGGKRKWVEQADCYKLIIAKLAASEKRIGVIFDGMTSSAYDGLDYSRLGEGIHDQIISSVISRFSNVKNVSFVCLNHCDPLEKLAVASKVDFFLSDAATSSMYVSRFGDVPGLVHSSSKIKGHLHKVVYEVPKEWVSSQSAEGWQFSDYNIDPVMVADLFFKLFISASKEKL